MDLWKPFILHFTSSTRLTRASAFLPLYAPLFLLRDLSLLPPPVCLLFMLEFSEDLFVPPATLSQTKLMSSLSLTTVQNLFLAILPALFVLPHTLYPHTSCHRTLKPQTSVLCIIAITHAVLRSFGLEFLEISSPKS